MGAERHCLQCDAILDGHEPGDMCRKCGAATTADVHASSRATRLSHRLSPPGTLRLPNLQILELIGQGGMGLVYKARQSNLRRLVAVKVLPLEVTGESEIAARFSREARSLARLNHPNIVAIYDFGQTAGSYYFVMELVDGTDLRRRMSKGAIDPSEAISLATQICDALEYAHGQGVIHRDIKPENVLLDRRGRVRVADFGIAKLLVQAPGDLDLTTDSATIGTPRYMAPEQMENPGNIDARADLFSLGVVLYEMLTGQVPMGRFAPPSKKAPVDSRLDEVLLRALDREPARRYPDAASLAADLRAIANSAPPVPVVPLSYERTQLDKSVVRQANIAATALFALSIAAMLIPIWIGWIWYRNGPPPAEAWYWWVFLIVQIGLVPLAGVVMFVAANQLRHLESERWPRRAALLALIPWTPLVLLGFPIGVGILRFLRKQKVRDAIQIMRQNRTQTRARPILHRSRLRVAAIIASVLLFSAASMTTLIRLRPPPRLFYTFGGYSPFVVGTDGPVLGDAAIRRIGLSSMQVSEANQIFGKYYREFVALERRHTQYYKDAAGHVHVTVSPFQQEADVLIDRMWAEVGGILDKQRIATFGVAQTRTMGLFRHEGRFTVRAELWKHQKMYEFKEDLFNANGSTGRGSSGSSAHTVFPQEYWIYWDQ